MPKKKECEEAIRSLTRQWAQQTSVKVGQAEQPSYFRFKDWLTDNGHGRFMEFRSVGGANWWIERWFDEELKQTWRN